MTLFCRYRGAFACSKIASPQEAFFLFVIDVIKRLAAGCGMGRKEVPAASDI